MRDHVFEDEFLANVVEEVARRTGIDVTLYPGAVRGRLEEGAHRYTDHGYLDPQRHNLKEVLEETPDIAVYAMLEIQRLSHDGIDAPAELSHHLFEASIFAAIADWHARQAFKIKRSILGE
jgi:hypothetical protein